MKIIVGLGNPGAKYERTRHNAGWLILDWLAESWNIEHITWNKNHGAEILQTEFAGQNILLVKPQTFMNQSGKAVIEACNFYKIDVKKDLLVIHDDSDLPLGTIRLTDSSSSAGHNGVSDIIEKLGTQDFHRIRIGVETRKSKIEPPTETFVLQNFTAEEIKKLQEDIFPKAKLKIENFLKTEN